MDVEAKIKYLIPVKLYCNIPITDFLNDSMDYSKKDINELISLKGVSTTNNHFNYTDKDTNKTNFTSKINSLVRNESNSVYLKNPVSVSAQQQSINSFSVQSGFRSKIINITLNKDVIEYIYQISTEFKLSKETVESALYLFKGYLNTNPKTIGEDVSLLLLSCLYLSSKVSDFKIRFTM